MPRALLVLFVTALTALTACAAREPELAATLRTQTQALLDAVSAGDPAVWQRLVDRDARCLSEDGTVETKASLVAQLQPFPPGISGTLTIASFELHRHGDLAVAIHTDRETEQYFGQALVAEYRMIDTWQRTAAGWRLVATGVHVTSFDPPALELPVDQLDDYAGTYRLTDAITYTIRRDGTRLVGRRSTGGDQPLRVELRDVLFVPGQPRSRKVFVRGGDGHVTGFLDRREGHDVRWTKLP